jgi:hypothetical protein
VLNSAKIESTLATCPFCAPAALATIESIAIWAGTRRILMNISFEFAGRIFNVGTAAASPESKCDLSSGRFIATLRVHRNG